MAEDLLVASEAAIAPGCPSYCLVAFPAVPMPHLDVRPPMWSLQLPESWPLTTEFIFLLDPVPSTTAPTFWPYRVLILDPYTNSSRSLWAFTSHRLWAFLVIVPLGLLAASTPAHIHLCFCCYGYYLNTSWLPTLQMLLLWKNRKVSISSKRHGTSYGKN